MQLQAEAVDKRERDLQQGGTELEEQFFQLDEYRAKLLEEAQRFAKQKLAMDEQEAALLQSSVALEDQTAALAALSSQFDTQQTTLRQQTEQLEEQRARQAETEQRLASEMEAVRQPRNHAGTRTACPGGTARTTGRAVGDVGGGESPATAVGGEARGRSEADLPRVPKSLNSLQASQPGLQDRSRAVRRERKGLRGRKRATPFCCRGTGGVRTGSEREDARIPDAACRPRRQVFGRTGA